LGRIALRSLRSRSTQIESSVWAGFRSLYASEKLPWVIIGFGAVLRVLQYLYNRSLWNDEAGLALNIVGRSFAGLLQPLSYGQAAPFGFLVVEGAMLRLL
jgi:hypothetical protein